MRSAFIPLAVVLVTLVTLSYGLKCWRCGQYTDGVGSITPCNNDSAAKLEECSRDSKFCIKYVSQLTAVRDCVNTCTEKEWWGSHTYCCDTDECNAAVSPPRGLFNLAAIAVTTALAMRYAL